MQKKKKSFWHIGTIYDDVDPKDQWFPALLHSSLVCFLGGMYLYLFIRDFEKPSILEWLACAIAVFLIGRGIYEFILKLRLSINARRGDPDK